MRLQGTFTRKHLLGIFLAATAIAAVMGERAARPLRQVAGFLLPPLSDAPMYAVTQIGSGLSGRRPAAIGPKEADRLRRENDYLRRLSAYWRYREEVYRKRSEDLANFKGMYGATRDLACELIPARVVAAGTLPYDQTRMVSRTSPRRIQQGAAVTTRQILTQRSKVLPPRLTVVNANFLVGRITDSGAFTARLQLATDRNFRMHARIRRVIAPGRPRMVTVTEGDLPRTTPLGPENNHPIEVLAVGDGARRLVARQVKEYYKVRPGDLLVASPSQENVPTEIHIGKVVEVRRDREDARRVTVFIEPHADLENIRNVYILSPIEPPGSGS